MRVERPFRLAWLLVAGLLAAPSQAETGPRVLSMAPSLTELVFELGFGDHLVGRSTACDYPPEAAAIPAVGGFGRPNLEALQRLKPDIVLATDLEKGPLIHRLNRMDIRTHVLPCEDWDGLMAAARVIGDAMGDPDRAERWIVQMTRRRDELIGRTDRFYTERERPSVYVEIWKEPMTTAGRDSFLHELVTWAGGRHIGGSLPGRYKQVSAEWIVRENPDVILLAYMIPSTSAADDVGRRVGWGRIRAVEQGRVCDRIHPDWLLRPGPRWIKGAEALADYLMSNDDQRSLTTDEH